MKDIFLKRIVCILVAVSFLLPLNVLTADDPKDEGSSYGDVNTFTWREAESWDKSVDYSNSSYEWNITYAPEESSDRYYTRTDPSQPKGDYAEWNFTVLKEGKYYFYVRTWIKFLTSSSVLLYWNNELIGEVNNRFPIDARGSWYWKYYGNLNLSFGTGTLKIYDNTPLNDVVIDNILITNNGSYNPSGKEVEGSTNHFIGAPCLDYGYIKDVTVYLSDTIYNAYGQGDIAKGRAFGTAGEYYAAYYIQLKMNNIGLYNVTREQIESIPSGLETQLPTINITDKLETISQGITIHNGGDKTILEFHIQPSWNWRFWQAVIAWFGNQSEGENWLENLLELIFDDYQYNLTFNDSWLTKNSSYENLIFKPRPTNFSWFCKVLLNETVTSEIMNNESIVNYSTFMHYFLPEFQEIHDFTFGILTPENAGDYFEWFQEQWKQSRSDDPFVYIGEDPTFNPNATEIYPCLKNIADWMYNCSKPFLKEIIIPALLQIESLLFNITMPECKGVVYYDFNNKTHDMNYRPLMALPTLYINGSEGKPINSSINDYTIDFHINQSWNESVISYNVIGQINGTNQNETVIVCCLYDSWWNQGTADSAIGMAITLAIAKHFKEYNITPCCNIKFIAFGGEEYGLRGAYYYEAAYRNEENVTALIDLNQLGFKQEDPRLTLNIILNNESLNSTVKSIVERTNYVDRLQNTTDFRIINTSNWDPLSDYTPFYQADNKSLRSCNTICFLKDRGIVPNDRWILHHRDGQNHNEGDSIKYYHTNDVVTTAEMILNVTKYFTAQSTNITLNIGWNCISTQTNDPIFKSNLFVSYDGTNYTWTEAQNAGIVGASIFWWNTSGPWYSSMSEDNIKLQPGHGYWIYVYEGYDDCELLVYSNIHDFNPIAFIEDDGWNNIGIPGRISVNLSSLNISYNGMNYTWPDAVSNDYVEPSIFWWNTSGPWYDSITDDSTILDTNKGYWIYSYVNNSILLYGDSQGGGEKDGGDKGEHAWEVKLNFSEPGDAVTNNVYFGENSHANDGPPHDEYDLLMPPQGPITPYIRAWFDDNLSIPYDAMMKDFRYGPVKSKTWNLTILWYNTTNTTINISWDPDSLKDCEYKKVELYDVSEEERVADMLKDSYYNYNATAYYPKSYEIRCSAE